MDSHALGYRNMAFLLSLGVLPACPGNEPVDPTEDGTATQPSTDAATGTTANDPTMSDPTTTTGTTAEDPTGGTTGPDATTGEGEETGATTGEVLPVPEVCAMLAQKYVECYPRYASASERYAQGCAKYVADFAGMYPDCVSQFEEWNACLSKLSCEEFTSEELQCETELAAVSACTGE